MGTKIEWVTNPDGSKGESWNPVTGCSKVDEGCRNCYAERMSKRLRGRCGYPADDPFRVTLHPDRLDKPLHWHKPRRVFVNSMSDLFHPWVSNLFISRVFAIMALASNHDFMILTKRPERIMKYFNDPAAFGWEKMAVDLGFAPSSGLGWPLPNVWLGVSVHDQKSADERIPILLQTPAAHRFISQEPALGLVSFINALALDPAGIDLIITGGESGPGARPMHPDWARSTRDQCAAAGVKFHFKQHGDWEPFKVGAGNCPTMAAAESALYVTPDGKFHRSNFKVKALEGVRRVGKKAAGRLLDGVLHDGA